MFWGQTRFDPINFWFQQIHQREMVSNYMDSESMNAILNNSDDDYNAWVHFLFQLQTFL